MKKQTKKSRPFFSTTQEKVAAIIWVSWVGLLTILLILDKVSDNSYLFHCLVTSLICTLIAESKSENFEKSVDELLEEENRR